ncbi:hypothetical protein [Natronorubrum bangense]|uniref:DUF8152 domain-containing protein n=2 Tax=Natronorubrum bangense TaxID=61858 RepID=L9WKL2_9EURY|nr:hypothetical protein [Natronorubrum bangense]ELY49927.1 hypothetical protein C494_07950 [Natronorubrum bangense JCM 10635]QCC55544.1 hypothetical protein DV706_14335 [Natronorubrum bangense]
MTDESTPPTADADSSGRSLTERTRRLHRQLEATAELPIDREANRWLGEAEAIASDVATSDLEAATVHERVEKINHLLAAVDETGHDEADDHLEAATQVAAAILESSHDNQ